jgi:hypothetical protein
MHQKRKITMKTKMRKRKRKRSKSKTPSAGGLGRVPRWEGSSS